MTSEWCIWNDAQGSAGGQIALISFVGRGEEGGRTYGAGILTQYLQNRERGGEHCATSRKVAGSRPHEVNGFKPNYEVEFIQPLTKMSTRSREIMFQGSRARPVHRADTLAAICEPIVRQCGILNMLQLCRPPRPLYWDSFTSRLEIRSCDLSTSMPSGFMSYCCPHLQSFETSDSGAAVSVSRCEVLTRWNINRAWNLRPPLWSSGRSSRLQIQRPGFDSRHYQNFWEAVGLEWGPLSLVSTTEELLERQSSGFDLETRDYVHKGSAALTTRQLSILKVGTNFADKRRSFAD
jgi:hypothetical protein